MGSPEKITSILNDFFDLTFKSIVELHQKDGGRFGLRESELKEYKYDQLGVRIRKYVEAELTYISFLEEYAKMVSKWLETFSYLVDMLGSREYNRILSREVELWEVINPSALDITFLKFMVKTFLNPNFSDLETICGLVLEKSKKAVEEVNHHNPASSKKFIELIKNQSRDWLVINEEVQICLQSIPQVEDKSQILFTLTMIAQKFILFFEKITETKKAIKDSDENWKNFVEGGFIEFLEHFKKIKDDIIELFECLIKTHEHLLSCSLHILSALWGREVAQSKMEDFVKSKIPVEGLMPKNFSIKDLAFGLALARSELGQCIWHLRD